MQTKGLNRKDFLKGTVAGLAALLVGKLYTKRARAMETIPDVTYSDEPAIGQPGYEKRVARLFKDKGLPEKATRI